MFFIHSTRLGIKIWASFSVICGYSCSLPRSFGDFASVLWANHESPVCGWFLVSCGWDLGCCRKKGIQPTPFFPVTLMQISLYLNGTLVSTRVLNRNVTEMNHDANLMTIGYCTGWSSRYVLAIVIMHYSCYLYRNRFRGEIKELRVCQSTLLPHQFFCVFT